MVHQFIKRFIPTGLLAAYRRRLRDAHRREHEKLPAFTEQQFDELLSATLGIHEGGLYMIHSSLNKLKLDFPSMKVLHMLQEKVGKDGTLMFLTTSKAESEMDFLNGDQVFNRRRTPTGVGLLSELARRMPGARRSMHPTKSVCAVGPLTKELTTGHDLSPYPFDRTSPYGKFVERKGTVIGLGVTPFNLSIAHCVEDFMKEEFPHPKYLGPHTVECIDYDGSTRMVTVLASNPNVMAAGTCMNFFDRYISEDILQRHVFHGQDFFRCDSASLIRKMLTLAKEGKTIYSP